MYNFDQRNLNDSKMLKTNLVQNSNFIEQSLSSSRIKETHKRVIITPKLNKVQFQKYQNIESKKLIGSSYPDEYDVTTTGVNQRHKTLNVILFNNYYSVLLQMMIIHHKLKEKKKLKCLSLG